MPVVQVKVTNRLLLPKALPEHLVTLLKQTSEHKNPAYHKAKAMGFWSKEPKVLKSWTMNRGALSLPRGRTNELRKVFADAGLELELVDGREYGAKEWAGEFPAHKVQLWDHQHRCVEAILDIEQGLVRAPTGSGKTTAGIAAIAQAQLPTLVVVWTGGLVEQWVERICNELGLTEDEVGVVGNGVERWRPITVSMQQTLARSETKRAKASKLFGFLLCDEVQKFAASTFLDVVDWFPSRFRIGLSADERRKDQKEPLIYDVFGRVIAEIDRKDLEKKELVLPVTVKVVPTEFAAPWYEEAMRTMHMTELSQRQNVEGPDFTRLLDEMTKDMPRNELVMQALLSSGVPTIALTHRREHALLMRQRMAASGMNCGLLLGGKENSAEFSDTVAAMRLRTLQHAAGTYQAVGQGLDIPPAACAVCTTPIAANKQFFGQVRGRICRTSNGKHSAELVYFWDHKVFGVQALHNLARWNDRKVVVWHERRWQSVDDFLEVWRG